jgi:hypothetical protein
LALIRAPASLSPAVARLLFQPHWILQIAGLVVAIVMIMQSFRQPKQSLRWAGISLAVLIALWMIAATAVVTREERLKIAQQQLLAAVEHHDAAAMTRLLIPSFTWGNEKRDAIVQHAMSIVSTITIHSNAIESYDATITGYDADVRLVLLTKVDVGPIQTTWQLDWYDDPGADWQLAEVRSWSLFDQPQSNNLPRASQ